MIKTATLTAIILLLPGPSTGSAQERALRCRVTYCTSLQIYLDAGTADGLVVGDTLAITRGDTSVCAVSVSALASHSSVCRFTSKAIAPRIGDIATARKTGTLPRDVMVPPMDSVRSPEIILSPASRTPALPAENVLGGRIALQYLGQIAEDKRLNINQPALSAQVRLDNLAGTGIALSLRGREYYDIGGPYLRYGDSLHSRLDVSELSVSLDQQTSAFGFSAGRFVSRYAVGLGPLDGGEAFIHQGRFTAGALAGAGVFSRVTGIGADQTSVGGFLGYHDGDLFSESYDASIAYIRQTVGGKADRTFLALRNSYCAGGSFSAYGSADVELQQMNSGTLSTKPWVSSVVVFAYYTPLPWLSTNFGYDGSRSVYLFESMKSVPDSLFHEALRNGFRASGTARLGTSLTLTAEASYRSGGSDGGSSNTFGVGARLSDIFSTRIYGGMRIRVLGGSFLSGTQTTLSLGRQFFQRLDAMIQYDSRSFTVDPLKQTYTTQTITADVDYRLSRNVFGTLGGDYFLDNTMNALQIFAQLGYRF
jgi:hypothetical protein